MGRDIIIKPDNTAVRTALWRALHVRADAKPHILEDEIGFKLIAPDEDWQERPDMKYTKRLRASIVARSRFIEDIAKEQIAKGIKQYVLLGAGLDTFAQRNTEISSQVDIYEIDQPDTLTWKEEKLIENGYKIPGNLHFVPVDFEISSWWDELLNKGFDINKKAVVSCTGVTLYLTKEAITDTLKKMTLLASGSTIAIAFYLPLEQLDEEDKPMQEIAMKGAAASGTPFVSFFSAEEIIKLAEKAGLKEIQTISTKEMTERYFKKRTDNLLPASGEVFLVAKT
ncbi:class I SAM-dependent methyltransferase [Sphingobacterium thalpophilum]|uniref:S-adenosyl-L-methionine-dependent methyltransferase n=1 Tax=Sphingobacterium thalpophilum TaxID=259 RepID=A0A4U9VP89_9SPHI|nr:class I SAM-dependent methyltransferase [Sphingobacterium thalpophilum]VTR47492.1 Putative S-adenosyl-L-methionine-dependent methyltransferase ML2640 [Sphingobacterium thalpophilum]